MTRLRYRLYRLASGLRYRIPRRFTPAGLLALAAAMVSGAIGIDMDQTVAFQAFAFVVCLLAVSMVSAIFFRGRFAVRRVRRGNCRGGEQHGTTKKQGTNRSSR